MHLLRILLFCGLITFCLHLYCEDPNEKSNKELRKQVKENYFHLKKARKNMLAGIEILKNDIEVPISREARQLIHWTINHYFDLLKNHKKFYS